ncbi:ferrous iron transport protein B [Tetragenococcus halophilus]|uniref:ferrous iron transport protein B n=1 Tax=Tetragenococcus halophilus TaxID=51669 RepID=UPI002563102B|nr:ferrous iron transport protein B [Tetragenococcus halophilus]GMG66523.1 ferrous iron transport protein B [Tetragenococcus halophilus]
MEKQFALAGNPNSGKTSAFNHLTGANQYVGNWPGVTIERKSGLLKRSKMIALQDLPGIYSLSPYTPEEVITQEYLLNQKPDAIINIIDSSNLERNLYLTTQLLETGLPVVLGMNMMDIVKKNGQTINLSKLAYGLGVPVIGMSALKKTGLEKLIETTQEEAEKNTVAYPAYDPKLESALDEISDILGNTVSEKQVRWYAIKLFEKDPLATESLNLSSIQKKEIDDIIQITEKIFDDQSDAILVNERYEFITRLISLAMIKEDGFKLNLSDKIDRFVTNRFLALPIFAIIMWGIYYLSIQTVGTISTDWVTDDFFGEIVPDFVETYLISWNVADWMQGLILEGIIAGVGAVLGFLPQIIILFLCLAILEDCGYMSRIAFVMDRLFRKFGLSGKSFIPMLIATGCGVPGVMASRTIENENDRRVTVMVTTFMPCSAKLPIIALIAGAFFPNSSWVAPSAYFVGIAAIVLSGIALKKTHALGGDPAPFVMELPTYHLPQVKNVLQQTWNRATAFVKKAGTIILVSSILIWFTSSFNFTLQQVPEDQSILAAFGRLIAPLFAPLGCGHWRGAVATLTGLIAKENVIGTFGILYGNLASVSESGREVWGLVQGDFTAIAAYSFLVFNLLCAPCFAAIGAIHREMANSKWTLLAVIYQCGLAYAVALITYQYGSVIFGTAAISMGTAAATIILLTMIYFIVRKPQQKQLVHTAMFPPLKEGK